MQSTKWIQLKPHINQAAFCSSRLVYMGKGWFK